MTDSHLTDTPTPDDQPASDNLQERVATLNQKAGDLADTLKRIDDRLTEAMGQEPEKAE